MRTGWLDKAPIGRKLAVLMIVVMAISFAVGEIITGVYGYRSDQREMGHHLDILASAIGDNCSAALVFEDESAAAEILSALQFDQSITGAVLLDRRSEVVAAFPSAARIADLRRTGGDGAGLFAVPLRTDRAIAVDGKTVGFLTIWAKNEMIVERAVTEAVVGMTALMVSVFLVLLVFQRAQRTLFAPLVDLQETVRKVVRSRNYSIRATRSGEDEINDVVMAVNDLLAQVEVTLSAAKADAPVTSPPAGKPVVRDDATGIPTR